MTEPDTPVLTPSFRERIYRRNFVFFLADNVLFNIASGIIGPMTVIPDFVRHLTGSEVLIGLLSALPIVGHSLPQLLVARYIVRHARKKWWFVAPNIPTKSMMLLFAAFLWWQGAEHTWIVLPAFFLCYGIASFGNGLIGVPWADLAGTSLNNRWRARMLGLTTASVSVIMLGIAPLIGIVLGPNGPGFPGNYTILFGAAGLIFAASIIPDLFFHELPGSHVVTNLPPLAEFVRALGRVLRDDRPFRAYIVTCTLISLFMMAAPFYVGYATVQLGQASEVAVPVLVAMQTAGSLAGALAYTWLGARSNLLAMRLAVAGFILLPGCALLAGMAGPLLLYAGFLLWGLSESIWNSGYLNWLVGYAAGGTRPLYVGLSNTLVALGALVAPLIGGTLAQTLGYRPLFAVALLMALCALYVALRFLRDAQAAAPREGAPAL